MFPTCQVRVARYYQNSSSFFSFSFSFSSPPRQVSRKSSSPSASPIRFAKLLANPLRQACLANPLRQLRIAVSTAGPQPPRSGRSAHRRTSTGDAPGSCSEHRWTSTGDLPSSASTVGLQPPDGMPGCMPNRMPDKMPK